MAVGFFVFHAHLESCITKYGSTYYIGMGIVPSIIDVGGYDREFCSSSPSPSSD